MQYTRFEGVLFGNSVIRIMSEHYAPYTIIPGGTASSIPHSMMMDSRSPHRIRANQLPMHCSMHLDDIADG
jgi:hypothetical protein